MPWWRAVSGRVGPIRLVMLHSETDVNLVGGFNLCNQCLDGVGGECHTPGCVLFLSVAPDIPIRDTILLGGGTVQPWNGYVEAGD